MKKRKNPNKKLLKLAGKFQPGDFGYMLQIEKQMLKQMQEYHSTANITVDNPEIARQIKWAIKLLDIADETNSAWQTSGKLFIANGDKLERNPNCGEYLTTYINTRNWKRFFTFPDEVNINWKYLHTQDHLRQRKAWYIYNKLRYLYLMWWWD